MGYTTIIHVILIIVSVVIITTYIQPTFADMQAAQDETQEYREALDNAEKFNAELQRLVVAANSLSTAERQALERYIPSDIDTTAVMRDIATIVDANGLLLGSLGVAAGSVPVSFTPAQGQSARESLGVEAHRFTVSVTGSYSQLKQLLQDFERNAYPLEVTTVNFSSTEDGLYQFSITLETYVLVSGTDDK